MTGLLDVPITSRDAPEVIDWLREQKISFQVHAGENEGRTEAKIRFKDELAVMLYRLRTKKLID